MKESLVNYYKINILPAIKNARSNARKSLLFVVSIVLIQFLLCTVSLASFQNRVVEAEEIAKSYSAHLIVRDVGVKDQPRFFEVATEIFETNIDGTIKNPNAPNVGGKKFKNAAGYDLKMSYVINNYENGTTTYDFYVTFTSGNIRVAYYSFIRNFNDVDAEFEVTPLLYSDSPYNFGTMINFLFKNMGASGTYHTDNETGRRTVNTIFDTKADYVPYPPLGIDGVTSGSNSFIFFIFNIVVTVASAFVLMSLYSERINHFKFDFGIFSAFGADTKKLIKMSVWEIMIIDIVILIPAALLSVGVLSIVYTRFVFSFSKIFSNWILSLLIVFIAVYFPVRRLRNQTPLERISAADNSNYVASPRRSAEIFGKKFPIKTANVTFMRFRKYYVKTVAVVAALASLFYAGSYAAKLYAKSIKTVKPQFVVNIRSPLSNAEDFEKFSESISSVNGVTRVTTDMRQGASYINSFVAVDGKSTVGKMSFTQIKVNGVDKYATQSVSYVRGDAPVMTALSSLPRKGDISLTGKTAVVSQGKDSAFSFSVGDKFYIAAARRVNEVLPKNNIGGLSATAAASDYEYIEYTVSAVVEDRASYGARIYLSEENYAALTGITPLMSSGAFVKLPKKNFNEESLSPFYQKDYNLKWIVEVGERTDWNNEGEKVTSPAFYGSYGFSALSASDALIALLESYDHEGDIAAAIKNGKAVLIASEYIDTFFIYDLSDDIPDLLEVSVAADVDRAGGIDGWLEYAVGRRPSEFNDTPLEIGAIVHIPREERLKMGFIDDPNMGVGGGIVVSPELYTGLTGASVLYDSAEIYIDEGLSAAEITKLFYTLRAATGTAGVRFTVSDTGASFASTLQTNGRYAALIVVISLSLLAAAIIILLFAQRLFYMRRELESYVLRTLGALESKMRLSHIYEGLLLAAVLAAAYSVLSFLLAFAIYGIAGGGDGFSPPLWSYFVGLAAVIIGGVASALTPYFIKKKPSKKRAKPQKLK